MGYCGESGSCRPRTGPSRELTLDFTLDNFILNNFILITVISRIKSSKTQLTCHSLTQYKQTCFGNLLFLIHFFLINLSSYNFCGPVTLTICLSPIQQVKIIQVANPFDFCLSVFQKYLHIQVQNIPSHLVPPVKFMHSSVHVLVELASCVFLHFLYETKRQGHCSNLKHKHFPRLLAQQSAHQPNLMAKGHKKHIGNPKSHLHVLPRPRKTLMRINKLFWQVLNQLSFGVRHLLQKCLIVISGKVLSTPVHFVNSPQASLV